MSGQGFKPGERVGDSGIYRVVHDKHRAEHEVTLFGGEKFPTCVQCGGNVRFHLRRAAGPIEQDRDFKPKKTRRKSAAEH